MDAILEENQPQADSRDEKSKHQQEEEDASIARGLLLNYEAVKGTFPAIAATEELSLTKLATMQSPALLTQNLVGKANFDSPVLSPKKEAEAPAAGEGKKKGKKVRRSQTLRVVKTDEAGGKSPLALAHMATSSDIGEKEIKTKYSKDAVIDVKNFNHQEKKEDYADETSFFKRTAKSITRSRKSKIDLTKDNSVRAKSVLADSSHVTPLNDGGKYTVTPKKAKPPKAGSVKLTSYTLRMEDRLIRKEDPRFHFDNYVGDRNVIDVRWYNSLQANQSRKKGHNRTRSNSH